MLPQARKVGFKPNLQAGGSEHVCGTPCQFGEVQADSGMFVKFARIEETSLDILALDPVTTLIERCVSGGFGAVRRDGVLVELVDGGVSKVAHLLDVLLLPAIKGEGSYLGDLNA